MSDAPMHDAARETRHALPPERDRSHGNALSLLWRDARALLWVAVAGEFLAAILTLALDTPGMLDRFAVVSLATQFVVLITVLALYLARTPLRRLSAPHAAWVAFSLMLLSTVAVAVLTRYVFEPVVALPASAWHSLVWRSVGIVAIAGSMGLVTLQNHWRITQLALQAKQAQLEALRARIQPHFLFNTLNTAVALVRISPDRVEQLLLDLSDVFRAALASPSDVPLSHELALTRRYLDIEQLRLGDRLRLEWRVPDALPDLDVPGLSIQPLAENAVRHGVEPSADGGCVRIDVVVEATEVVIRVVNDLSTSAPALPGHRVGLRSARERIAALGGGAGLETRIEDGRHVATVRLPLDQVTTR